MRIASVAYSRLCVTAQYENERMEATAELEPGDDPEMVVEALKDFVNLQLGKAPSDKQIVKRGERLESHALARQTWRKSSRPVR